MENSAIIVCEHVRMAFGRQEVLSDVNLEIVPGVLLPFVGPNGAGKTTLLRLILGLLTPTAGSIRTPFAARPAGYMPQHKAIDPLYPVTVRQIIEMGLYPELGFWRQPDRGQRGRVEAVLERFNLAAHQRKLFGELSGGMKQKTLLGRALISGADVFVMDEPTSELDEDSEREVLRHLAVLCREEGKTVLLAHHGLDQAEEIARQLCLVNRGRVRLLDVAQARAQLRAERETAEVRHA